MTYVIRDANGKLIGGRTAIRQDNPMPKIYDFVSGKRECRKYNRPDSYGHCHGVRPFELVECRLVLGGVMDIE